MSRNHVFDSNGPDMRLRGTAQQLFEKYLQLGRDATGSGDRVMAESYFQHAEHYFRILNAMSQVQQQQQGGPPQQQQRRYQNGPDQGNEGQNEGGDQQPEFNGAEQRPDPRGDQRPTSGASPGRHRQDPRQDQRPDQAPETTRTRTASRPSSSRGNANSSDSATGRRVDRRRLPPQSAPCSKGGPGRG